MTDDLIECYSTNKKLMPLIHLPIQSGSNNILRKNINSKKWLFGDSAHANDEGYKIISEIILDS